jgi:hypothetical protein
VQKTRALLFGNTLATRRTSGREGEALFEPRSPGKLDEVA